MLDRIKVTYRYTSVPYKVHKLLDEAAQHPVIAWDFEVASKYTQKEIDLFKVRYELNPSHKLQQKIETDGLSHPSLTVITHLSVAWSKDESIVIVCDNDMVRRIVFNWLVSIPNLQLIHNACFDLKHVMYNTGKMPMNFVDTQLMAKSLINNSDRGGSLVGLKELMGYCYGDWALSSDNFTLEMMHDIRVIKYAAIDSAATFKLYEDMQSDVRKMYALQST